MFFVSHVSSSSYIKFTSRTADCRQAILWPFTNESAWNTPLGSSAEFVSANLFNTARGQGYEAFYNFHSDDDYVIITTASDPLVPWYNQGHWGGPATKEAYCNITGKFVKELHFPTILEGNAQGTANLDPSTPFAASQRPSMKLVTQQVEVVLEIICPRH